MTISDPDLSQQRLSKYLLNLLGGTLGAGFSPFRKQLIEQPRPVAGFVYGLIYITIFCFIPKFLWQHNEVLIELSLWRGVYIFFAGWSVRAISTSVELLISEQHLKRVTNNVIFNTQVSIESKINLFLEKTNTFNNQEWESLSNLIALRRDLNPNSSLLRTIPSVLSIIVPFIGPIIIFLSKR